MNGASLEKTNISSCSLNGVEMEGAFLHKADLSGSCLVRAGLHGADLWEADLFAADLRGADVSAAKLEDASLRLADLSGANLQGARLEGCALTVACLDCAILTGADLYASERTDWSIKDIKCDHIYLDAEGAKRTPSDRDFKPSEFERLYAAMPTIEFFFEHGMTPMDLVVLDRVVEEIRKQRPDFDLKVATVDVRGLHAAVKLTVKLEEQKEPALELLTARYDDKMKKLEPQMETLSGLVARKLDRPNTVNLIEAKPGSFVAVDGSTISIVQCVGHLEAIEPAIKDAPKESLGNVARRTALDIVGGALKDAAKGEVKKAATGIIKLGAELGPGILKAAGVSAAMEFFRGQLGL